MKKCVKCGRVGHFSKMSRSSVKREGLVFNSTKCYIKKSEISFFGNTYTKYGIKPDIKKVHDQKNKGKPESKEDLMRFLGVITYLSHFTPDLATKAHSLHGLLKKTSEFRWETDHQRVFCFFFVFFSEY